METPLELRLRQLVHRVDDLHINLQKVSSRTLSNSRTTSLEDRLLQLEQGAVPEVEPSISTQIFDDLTMQMSIFEKRLDALEKKVEAYHKELYDFQDFWFDEDEHQTVVTNHENIQSIKLQLERQNAKLTLVVDTLTQHKMWPDTSHTEAPKTPYPNFPKWKKTETSSTSSRKRRSTQETDPARLHQTGVADSEPINLG